MKRRKQQLRNIALAKLIDIEVDKIKGKHQKEFKKYAPTLFDNSQINNARKYWRIFCFALKSFHNRYRHRCTLLIAIISLVIAALDRAITSPQASTIRIYLFLVSCCSFVIYIALFNIWYSDVQENFASIMKRLKKIESKINSLNINIWSNLNWVADKFIREIIEDEILSLADKWKQIGFVSFLSALFISLMYVYLIGDSLNENIIWAANNMGFKDFDAIKNLTTQTIVFSMFPLEIALLGLILTLSLEKRREYLKDLLAKIRIYSNRRSLSTKIYSGVYNQFRNLFGN